MATYEEIAVKRTDSTLLQRFTVAVEIAAAGVFTEDPGTANHEQRLLWAKRAFLVDNRSQDYGGRIMRLALALHSDIVDLVFAAAITDQQIQTVVNGYVNPLADAGI